MLGNVTEIIFTVEAAPDHGYVARALGHGIFTAADTLESLRDAVRDAVRCHFDEHDRPEIIRLRFRRKEMLVSTMAGSLDDPFACFEEWASDADTSGYSALDRSDDPPRD